MNLNNFHGPNAGYVLELYERYRQNPASVDDETRRYFENWTPPTDGTAPVSTSAAPAVDVQKIVGAVNLAGAIREYGHLAAQLDPLGKPPIDDPSLDPATHGITNDDLRGLPASLIGGPLVETSANAYEAIEALRDVYSSHIGYDYDHLRIPEERDWLRHAAEDRAFSIYSEPTNPKALLERLTQVEVFERFIHRAFPGKTRFSIEGLDMMVPMLDEVIGLAAEKGIVNILIGMAHRGRLNVLTHILGKPYAQILAEFKDPIERRTDTLGWTGDVKYHSGARRALKGGEQRNVVVSMAPNPSHLEAVNPVVEGMSRAAGTRVTERGAPQFDPDFNLPIVIHGDAAFPAQGVVAETLNLSLLPGYWTGGTLHIIANNQLGYTTEPSNARSTIYASDLAKGFKMPIVHVNADDPEACIEAIRLAFAYIRKFHKDFVIDLIGYRRYGHNEGDEPAFTQPIMYQKIEQQPTVRDQWAKALIERGMVSAEEAAQMVQRQNDELQRELDALNPVENLQEPLPPLPEPGLAKRINTTLPVEHLQALNEALLTVPEGFNMNPKLARAMQKRRESLQNVDDATIDWSTAEALAFASILADGTAIRMTGQDVERGTFSQRHAVLHDTESGETFTPLQNIPQAQAAFEIHDSPLSENAAIGFEYGYNVQEPCRLVIWEAQYGDFINSAQVILDEFLMSARAKWGQTPSLVLFLPHGWEGAGPDHSTGRVERFLQMAAEINMRIANCTSAAQFYHLLRRQALLLGDDPLPLIVLTPKSLLRHRLVPSSLRDLAEGHWQPVIDDRLASTRRDQVRRLLLCSGKIVMDLVTNPLREQSPAVAMARVEQLYPLPDEEIQHTLSLYPNLEEVVWLQEEPANMGAWEFVRPCLEGLIGGRCPLRYIGRHRNASPAEGSSAWHSANQLELVGEAYRLTEPVSEKE